MKKTDTAVKEPLIHITKRDALSWKQAILIRVIAVVCALIVTAIVIMVWQKRIPFAYILP